MDKNMEISKQTLVNFIEDVLESKIDQPYQDEDGIYFTWQGDRFYYNYKYAVVYSMVNHVTTHTSASQSMTMLVKRYR